MTIQWRQIGAEGNARREWARGGQPRVIRLHPACSTRNDIPHALMRHWVPVLAAVCFAIPGILALARTVWNTEQGAQGPIILTTGLWLLWREAAAMRPPARTPPLLPALAAMVVFGVLAVFAGIVGSIPGQWAASYLALVTALYAYIGPQGLRHLWFPLFYLAFLIPPPQSVIVPLTTTLKISIAHGAVALLAASGFQVAQAGASLFIDSYELLVAAGCSGLNSLVSLLAVGLFYIHLRHRMDLPYAILMALLIVPVAIFANLLRVIILLLVAHVFGIDAAQGLLHDATGIVMFSLALAGLVAVEIAIEPLVRLARGYAHG